MKSLIWTVVWFFLLWFVQVDLIWLQPRPRQAPVLDPPIVIVTKIVQRIVILRVKVKARVVQGHRPSQEKWWVNLVENWVMRPTTMGSCPIPTVPFVGIVLLGNIMGLPLVTGAKGSFGGPFGRITSTLVASTGVVLWTRTNGISVDTVGYASASRLAWKKKVWHICIGKSSNVDWSL